MNEVGQSDLESIGESCCPGLSAAAVEAAKRWAVVFKALADPTRLLILGLVAKNEGGVCECNIVDCTPLSQPTISYHIKVLKEAGLLDCEKRGLWCYYALRKDLLRQAAAALGEMGRVADLEGALENEEVALRQAPARGGRAG
ncbi:MAG TPA: metalloregulator ArsR/SmtB family transcription factor [Dehalococcoidia bacterium]|nr:metalloregulator ArsR/SmtB family transcription factor [Dehalococcoidia bacterium]